MAPTFICSDGSYEAAGFMSISSDDKGMCRTGEAFIYACKQY